MYYSMQILSTEYFLLTFFTISMKMTTSEGKRFYHRYGYFCIKTCFNEFQIIFNICSKAFHFYMYKLFLAMKLLLWSQYLLLNFSYTIQNFITKNQAITRFLVLAPNYLITNSRGGKNGFGHF